MRRSLIRMLALASLCLLAVNNDVRAQSQGAEPKWGEPAPALSLALLQAPSAAQATWESLKGQAVVLEFWATWCSGCIAQIPHLNGLTERFKDKPVRFIAITDEDQSVVTKFLPKRPIAGWVGLDAGSVTFTRYGIWGRPRTALIDANGVLRGIMAPTEVNESTIEQLLAGTLQMKQSQFQTPLIGTEPKGPMPLVQTFVRPAMAVADTGMSPGAARTIGNRWEAWGMDVRSLVSLTHGIPSLRIILPDDVPSTRYDVSIVLPDDSSAVRRAVLQHLLEDAFALSVRREVRETDVMILRKVGDTTATLQPAEKGRPISAVVSLAQAGLNRIVLDETGLTGRYVFVVAYPKTSDELFASVRALGLSLTPERRPVEMTVVKRAQKQ